VFKLARTGTDGLLNWVKTVQNFHESSLSCSRVMSSKAPTPGLLWIYVFYFHRITGILAESDGDIGPFIPIGNLE
jgi:hypothetical protein